MPTYLTLGTLTQQGYDEMAAGPDTVDRFVGLVDEMGGTFDTDDFYICHGSHDWVAIMELPDETTAARLADLYARTGRGRIESELLVAHGEDGYREYVDGLEG